MLKRGNNIKIEKQGKGQEERMATQYYELKLSWQSTTVRDFYEMGGGLSQKHRTSPSASSVFHLGP